MIIQRLGYVFPTFYGGILNQENSSFFYKGGGVWYIQYSRVTNVTHIALCNITRLILLDSAKYPHMQMGVKYIQPEI